MLGLVQCKAPGCCLAVAPSVYDLEKMWLFSARVLAVIIGSQSCVPKTFNTFTKGVFIRLTFSVVRVYEAVAFANVNWLEQAVPDLARVWS